MPRHRLVGVPAERAVVERDRRREVGVRQQVVEVTVILVVDRVDRRPPRLCKSTSELGAHVVVLTDSSRRRVDGQVPRDLICAPRPRVAVLAPCRMGPGMGPIKQRTFVCVVCVTEERDGYGAGNGRWGCRQRDGQERQQQSALGHGPVRLPHFASVRQHCLAPKCAAAHRRRPLRSAARPRAACQARGSRCVLCRFVFRNTLIDSIYKYICALSGFAAHPGAPTCRAHGH